MPRLFWQIKKDPLPFCLESPPVKTYKLICRTLCSFNIYIYRIAWYHLTDAEKARHHVYVGVVTEDDLDEFAKDEDSGDVDWSCFTSYSIIPGAFDSDNE